MVNRKEEGIVSIKSASAVGDIIVIHSVVLQMCLQHSQSSDVNMKSTGLNATVTRQYLGPFDSVQTKWRTQDPQSGIKESLWAIGTVKGGQQLQTFRSVGLASHAANQDVDLHHGMEVFLTIVAINNVGLASILQPAPILVDFTPPEIAEIVVESSTSRFDTSVLYLRSTTVTASWNGTADAESGIDYCEWGIGKACKAVLTIT